MTTNQSNLLSEFVFGNRQIMMDALRDEISDLSKAMSVRSSLLDYVSELQVNPSDVAAVVVNPPSMDHLKDSSSEAIEYRKLDISVKKAQYRMQLNSYLDQIIGYHGNPWLEGANSKVSFQNVEQANISELAKAAPDVPVSLVPNSSGKIYPKDWAKWSGNDTSESLLLKHKAFIKPTHGRIEPKSVITIPFKPTVWAPGQGSTGITNTERLLAEIRSTRRVTTEDTKVSYDHITKFITSSDGNFLLVDDSVAPSKQKDVEDNGTRSMEVINAMDLFRSISLFQQLNKDDLDSIEAESSVVSYSDGEIVLHAEQKPKFLHLVVAGTVCRKLPLEMHQFAGLELKTGDMFGASVISSGDDEISVYDFQCRGPVTILNVDRDQLLSFLSNHGGLDFAALLKFPPFYSTTTTQLAHEKSSIHQYIELSMLLLAAFDRFYVQGKKFLTPTKSTMSIDGSIFATSQNSPAKPVAAQPGRVETARRASRRQSYRVDPRPEPSSPSASSMSASLLNRLSASVSYSLSLEAVEKKRALLFNFLTSCVPYLEPDSGELEDCLTIIEEFLEVDRARYFEVNRSANVLVMKVPLASTVASSVHEFPLVGITGHVAKFQITMNIASPETNQLFDSKVDDAPGSLAKQLLCVPSGSVTESNSADASSNAPGVLQLANKLNNKPFSARDELMATLFAAILGSTLRLRSSWARESESVSSRTMSSTVFSFQVQLANISSASSSGPLKCVSTLLLAVNHSSVPISSAFVSPSFDSRASSSGPFCNFDFQVQFPGICVSNLPVMSKVRIEFVNKRGQTVGWAIIPVFGSDLNLIRGSQRFEVTSGSASIGTISSPCSVHHDSDYGEWVSLSFPLFDGRPVLHSRHFQLGPRRAAPNNVGTRRVVSGGADSSQTLDWYLSRMSAADKRRFDRLHNLTLAYIHPPVIDEADRIMLWSMRYALMQSYSMLPLMLLAVDWSNPDAVDEAYQLIHTWQSPDAVQLIQLLSGSFVDPFVRSFAAQKLNGFEDDELGMLLPFLVKLLVELEPKADNALSRQIILRCLENFSSLGMHCIQLLLAELNPKTSHIVVPLVLLLTMYCPVSERLVLGLQYNVVGRFAIAATAYIDGLNSKPAPENMQYAMEQFHTALNEANRDISRVFTMPVCDAQFRFTSIVVQACGPHPDPRLPLTFVIRLKNQGSDSQKFAADVALASQDEVGALTSEAVTTVLFTTTPRVEWKTEILARQVITVCNKCWELAGLSVFARDEPACLTSEGHGIRLQSTACRSLFQISVAAYSLSSPSALGGGVQNSASMTDINSSNLDSSRGAKSRVAVAAGSKDNRMDRATGIEVLDGFQFGEYKYHSESVQKWFTQLPADPQAVLKAFTNSLAGFCLLNYAFGLENFGGDSILFSSVGEIFLKDYFLSFLGINQPIAQSKLSAAQIASKRIASITLLPCFAVVLGMPSSPAFRLFEETFTLAFRVLRRQAKLIAAILTIGLQDIYGQAENSQILIEGKIAQFNEAMMIEMAETEAVALIQKRLYASLRFYLST